MPDPIELEVKQHGEESIQRELFGTRLGFILAAVGSAVGLGNMWRFPYRAAEGGGAAFVLLYIAFTLAIGIPLMLSEFAVGRRARLSPIGALRKTAGRAWVLVGLLFVLTGFLILSYYAVIAGWTVRYTVEGLLTGFAANPADHFGEVTSGIAPIVYHVAFMLVTITIVMYGVEKGIERAALLLMPTLFLILVGLAIWSGTLEGGGDGYRFYLAPDIRELLNPGTISEAAGQAFFSLSLGMGAMLTFASYLSRHENLNREAVVISFSDFLVAFIGGLVVFPVIFGLGLSESVNESTVGALFIALPGAFASMGALGRIVGILFFGALVVAALTSAISLLEVVTASVIDEFKIQRRAAAITSGILITVAGVAPALSLDVLGAIDGTTEFALTVGAFLMAIAVGWRMKDPAHELADGASPFFIRNMIPGVLFFVKWILPPVIAFVMWFAGQRAWAAISGLF